MIYTKKYTFGLCAYSWHRALKTLGLSQDESIKVSVVYVNKVTFGKASIHLKMQAGCQGNQGCD